MYEVPTFTDYGWGMPEMNPVEHALAYEHMETNMTLKLASSYLKLHDELMEQYEALLAEGYTFEFVEGEPYANSKAMMADVLERKYLKVRKTIGSDYSDLDAGHPMMEKTYLQSAKHGECELRPINDIFRAVHDIVGHAATRSGFGPDGEAMAWLQHRNTLASGAHLALWCETRGQNAWTNYYGNHAELPIKDRPFAPQKYGMVDARLI